MNDPTAASSIWASGPESSADRADGGWWSRVPIADPVDRRNAPMMQVVLLMLGVLPPLAWLYRILAPAPWRPGETFSLILSLAFSALALFSFVLIRRARFQWAVRQLMLVVAAMMMLSYLGNGFDANRFEQPIQMIWLVIAGLMIGRRALWLMYGWTVLAFGAGVVRDLQAKVEAASSVMNIAGDVVISALIFLFIAIVLDRSVAALRESLDEANRRGRELAEANTRLQAEMAERERVETQLIHAQKVETIGRLASGVAHDFNHLLGLASGYVARGRRHASGEEMATVLAGIDSALRRATAVSHKLLTFSRPEPTRTQVIDVIQVITGMKPLLRQLFDADVRLEFELPQRSATVRFDPSQLELALLNIAANADHAMPEGGCFSVAVQADDAQATIFLRDTGHGMSEDVRARVFEPFFTTKPEGQGTGLGLAVTYDLVAKAGGSLEVHSVSGEGSTFVIRLPLQRPDTRESETNEAELAD